MPEFGQVFREERHYCTHLFRVLCEGLGAKDGPVALKALLEELDLTISVTGEIANAAVYTEAAVFRDVYFASKDKNAFLEQLYDRFLRLIGPQYKGNIATPLRPSQVRERIGTAHPAKYQYLVKEPTFELQDVLFYREVGALFNAKPDMLIVLPKRMIWIEAKYRSPFTASQLQRMDNIGHLCCSDLFADYFAADRHHIVLLGLERDRRTAEDFPNTQFLSWQRCASIARSVMPSGNGDYSARALTSMT